MIQSRLGGTVFGSGGKIHSPSPLATKQKKPAKTDSEQKAANLGLKLLAKDDLNSDDLMRLEEDVTLFIRDRIESGNFADAKEFLVDHKDHLTSEMKEMATIEISNMKSEQPAVKKEVTPEVKADKDNNNITIEIKFNNR